MTTASKAVCGGEGDLQRALTKLYRHALNCPGAEYDGDAIESANRVLSAALASTAGAGAGDLPTDLQEAIQRLDAIREEEHRSLKDGGGIRLYRIAPAQSRAEELSLEYVRSLLSAVPASPRSGAGEGEIAATQITLGEGLVDITRIEHEGRVGVLFKPREKRIAYGEPGELPEGKYWPVPGDVVLWVSGEGPGVAIEHLSALSQGGGAGRSERAVEIRELSEKATTGAPCHWGGGNDIIWCSTCGAQYAYAKGEERPPCPRSAAPVQSPSTSDAEG